MKKISLILITALILGIIAPLPESWELIVRAADQEPSIYHYATREQLMDSALFNMKTADAADKGTVGYINFGKQDGIPKHWYVIGKDKGIGRDNVILYSCESMDTGYFWDTGGTIWVDEAVGDVKTREVAGGVNAYGVIYEDGSNPTTVCSNNYGVSDLRKRFQELETDTNYFSKPEQALMLQTVISTYAPRAHMSTDYVSYTVTDKLYAPTTAWDVIYDGMNSHEPYDRPLLFGSGEEKDLVEGYPKGNVNLHEWIRTPVVYFRQSINPPDSGKKLGNSEFIWHQSNEDAHDLGLRGEYIHFNKCGYNPAFALDLSNVLFASSVPASAAGEGVLDEPGADSKTNSAMTLRMKGSGRKFPETSLTCTPESIAYKSGRTDAYLVIQGKTGGGKDWYYSRPIVQNRSYNIKWTDMVDAINIPLGTIVDPAVSIDKCRIWIEAADPADGLTYVFTGESLPEEPQEITNVILTDIDSPDPETKAFDRTARTSTEGVKPPQTVSWFQGNTDVTDKEPAYEQTYTASVTLEADTGYKFSENVTATVNGHAAKVSFDAATGLLTVTYDFDVGKKAPKIEFKVDAFSGKYDGDPHSITATPTNPADATVYYGVADEEGKVTYTGSAPQYINAGKYTVYIRIEKDGYIPVEDYTAEITISKRRLQIKAEDQKVVWDDPLPIAEDKYEVDGELLPGDKVVNVSLKAGPPGLKAGDTGWITTYNGDVTVENRAGDDVSANYMIDGVQGELTIVHNPDLKPMHLTVKKTKTKYKTGDILELDDLEVTAVYEDGYSETVTDYTTNADSLDMSRAGTKELIVSYEGQEGEVTITVEDEERNDNNSNKDDNNNPGASSGNSGGNETNNSGSTGGQTGDQAPLTRWLFTSICSELVILCCLLICLKKKR